MSTASATLSESLARHFEAGIRTKAEENVRVADRAQAYREMSVESINGYGVRIAYPDSYVGSAALAELATEEAAVATGVTVEFHYDRPGSFLAIWTH